LIPPCTLQHRCILAVQDDLSKFLRALLLEDQTAQQMTKAFLDHIMLIYGIPQVILSNCGSQFLSGTFRNVCKLLGIKRIQSTSFWPHSNGSNERSHKGLIEYLTNYFAVDLNNWDQWVKCAVFVHSITPHSATSHMSFKLLFGQLPNLPGVLQRQPPIAFYAYDMCIKELEAMLQSSYAMARKNLETSKVDNKCQYDCCIHVPKFEIGNKFR
jgi:transposase InsO family protein